MENPQPLLNHPDVRHHDTGFSARGVGWFCAGLAATLIFAGILMALLFGLFTRLYPRNVHVRPVSLRFEEVPNPKLDVAPHLDLERMRSREDAILNSYGWVDRSAGVARIPIDRAMDLLAARNVPVRLEPRGKEFQPQGKATPFLPPAPESPQRTEPVQEPQ